MLNLVIKKSKSFAALLIIFKIPTKLFSDLLLYPAKFDLSIKLFFPW